MKSKFLFFRASIICLIAVLIASTSIVKAQILISGIMAHPADSIAGTDAPYEYVQLMATQYIDFSVTNYCIVVVNNTATSTATNGWIDYAAYALDLTSGVVNKGDIFYVGGSGKKIDGYRSTNISSANWIRSINMLTTTGDDFGTNGPDVIGNGGPQADGIAVFSGLASKLTSTTIPLDAVFYGTAIGTAKPATGGYVLPTNDRYNNAQGTLGYGTNTFLFPNVGTNNQYLKFTGTYSPKYNVWNAKRTGTVLTLNILSTLTTIATGIVLQDPSPTIAIGAPNPVTSYANMNSDSNIIQRYGIKAPFGAVTLDTIIVTTSGNYTASDIKTNGFKLWYSKTALLDSSYKLLQSLPASGPGKLTFATVNTKIDSGTNAFFIFTADISATANLDTIRILADPLTNFLAGNAKKSGTDPALASGPTIIINPTTPVISSGSLNPFGKTPINSHSTEQHFLISGKNLTPTSGNISITPPAGFMVSFTSGSGFSSSGISKSYTASALPTSLIYVVFTPTTMKAYSGNITISGGGASTVNIPVSGVGINNDSIPPHLDTAFAISATKIKLVFSEPVDTSATNRNHYTTGGANGIGPMLSLVRSANLDTVTITLQNALPIGTVRQGIVNNIRDTSIRHNMMTIPQTFRVSFGKLYINTHKIIDIRPINALGVADSNNITCRIFGVVQGINYGNVNTAQFFIHDGTAGILILKSAQLGTYTVRMGDSVRVVGLLAQSQGLLYMTADSFSLVDSFQPVRTPEIVSKLNETTESEVVKIKNLTLLNATQWPITAGATRSIQATNGTDTFTITIIAACNLQGTPAPKGIFDITGIGSQQDNTLPYLQGYYLLPRTKSDLFIHPPAPLYTIAQIRPQDANGVADSIGVVCYIRGLVYAPNFNSQGLSFTIEDSSGGINVYKGSTLTPSYTVREGDKIKLFGSVAQYDGLTQFIPDSIKLVDSNQALFPYILVTQLDESTESRLVRIDNLHIVPPSQWPTTAGSTTDVEVSNGSFDFYLRIFSNCTLQGTPVPNAPFSAVGIGSQDDNSLPYTSNYILIPRYKADLNAPVGIDLNKNNSEISIYPNPSNGNFSINNTSKEGLYISLFNPLGQLVYESTNSDSHIYVNVSGYDKGVYILKLVSSSSGFISTYKVIFE